MLLSRASHLSGLPRLTPLPEDSDKLVTIRDRHRSDKAEVGAVNHDIVGEFLHHLL
jgi:hypothetical protein